ncbi:MAG: hydrogenase maturation nickel metallochaperone HypA [Planctomycetales bacterium]|nr:hydrogenase maturation nickel metallochaperone HypA [Planctomycetales bacterium]
MHELSIANSLVEIASSHAERHGAQLVRAITLRVGQLSCVHKSALQFCFELASKDTLLEGATLQFIDEPVAVYCPQCQVEVELPGIQSFRCPRCGVPTGDIRRGRELDVETIEIV